MELKRRKFQYFPIFVRTMTDTLHTRLDDIVAKIFCSKYPVHFDLEVVRAKYRIIIKFMGAKKNNFMLTFQVIVKEFVFPPPPPTLLGAINGLAGSVLYCGEGFDGCPDPYSLAEITRNS
jgi:hypothetical protein